MSSLRSTLNELAKERAKLANVYLVVPKGAETFYTTIKQAPSGNEYLIANMPNDPASRGVNKLLVLGTSPDNASMRSSSTALFSNPNKRNIGIADCLGRTLSLSAESKKTLGAALALLGHMYSNEGRSSTQEIIGDPEVGWWEHLTQACETLDNHRGQGQQITSAVVSAAFGFPDIGQKTNPAEFKTVAKALEEAYETRWSTESAAEAAYSGLSDDALCRKIAGVLQGHTDNPESAAFQHFHQKILVNEKKRRAWRGCLQEIGYDKFIKPEPSEYMNVTSGSPTELCAGTYVVVGQKVDLVWHDGANGAQAGTVWTLHKQTSSGKKSQSGLVSAVTVVRRGNDVLFTGVALGDDPYTNFVAKVKSQDRPQETGARVDVYRSDVQPVAYQKSKTKTKSLKPKEADAYQYDDEVTVYWSSPWSPVPPQTPNQPIHLTPGNAATLTNSSKDTDEVRVEVSEKEPTGVVWPLVATVLDEAMVKPYDPRTEMEKKFEEYEIKTLDYVANGDVNALMCHLLPAGEKFDSGIDTTYRDVVESLAACVKKFVGDSSSNFSGNRFKELAGTPEEMALRDAYIALLETADATGDRSQRSLARSVGCSKLGMADATVFCSPFHPVKLLWLVQADSALAALRASKNGVPFKDPAHVLYATLRPLEWPRHVGDRSLLPGPASAVASVFYHTWIRFGKAEADGSSLEIGRLLEDFSKERPGAAKLTISVTGDTTEDGRGVHRSAARWLKDRSDRGLPVLAQVNNVTSDPTRLRPLGESFREILREESTPGELLPAGLTYTTSNNAPTDKADIGVHMAGVRVNVVEQDPHTCDPITVAPSGSLTQVALTKHAEGKLAAHVEIRGDDLAEAYHKGSGVSYKQSSADQTSLAQWNVYPDDQFPPCVVAAWPTENTDTILWDWLNPISHTPSRDELKKGAGVAPRSQIVSCTLPGEETSTFGKSGVSARDVLKTVGAIGLRGTPIFTDIDRHANGLLGLYGCLRALRAGAETRGTVPCVIAIDACKGVFSNGSGVEEEPNSRADLLIFWADKDSAEKPRLNFCVIEVKYSDSSKVPHDARKQANASTEKLRKLLLKMHDKNLMSAEKTGWSTLYMNLLNVGIGTTLDVHGEKYDRGLLADAVMASVCDSSAYKVHDPVVAMICPDPNKASRMTDRDVALGLAEVVTPLCNAVPAAAGARLWDLLSGSSDKHTGTSAQGDTGASSHLVVSVQKSSPISPSNPVESATPLPAVPSRAEILEEAHTVAAVTPLLVPRRLAPHVGFEKGEPFLLEWYNKTLYPNVNTGVAGKMGSGKTQLLKTLLSECQDWSKSTGRKLPILVLDYKKDYSLDKSFVNATGAVIHDIVNLPLDVVGVRPEHSSPEVDRAARRFYNILKTIYPGLGPVQEQLLVDAVKNLAGQAPITIERLKNEYLDQTNKPDSLSSILDKFDGQSIFSNNQSALRPLGDMLDSGGIHVVALDQLGSDMNTQSAVLALLLALYYDYMGSLEKAHATDATSGARVVQALLLVDEAVNVMKYKYDLFEKLLREGREYGVATILASQTLEDFFQATAYGHLLSTWIVLNGGSSAAALGKLNPNMRRCEPEKLVPHPDGSEAYFTGTTGIVQKITSRPFHTTLPQQAPAK